MHARGMFASCCTASNMVTGHSLASSVDVAWSISDEGRDGQLGWVHGGWTEYRVVMGRIKGVVWNGKTH